MDNKVKICAYCQRPIHPQVGTAVCSGCKAVYHRQCWEKRNACVTVGCTGMPILTSARPAQTQSPQLSQTFAPEPEEGPVQTVYKCSDTVIFEDVSLLLEDVKLVLDRENAELNAYFSFRNLQAKPIWAMKLELTCYDIWGEALDEPNEYEFIDLHAKFNKPFLGGAPVPLPVSNTRRVQADVKKVLYVDGTVALGTGKKDTLAPLTTLQAHFGSELLAKQYAAKTTELARYVPRQGEKHWRCTCGMVHDGNVAICTNCGCALASALDWLSQERLAQAVDLTPSQPNPVAPAVAAQSVSAPPSVYEHAPKPAAVPAAPKQEPAKPVPAPVMAAPEPAKAEKGKAEKPERRRHPVRKAICWLLVLALVACLAVFVALPGYHYLLGKKALKAGAYEKAYEEFSAASWFLDSEELADQCEAYHQAQTYLAAGDYAQAEAAFRALGDYLDAPTMVLECRYQKAKALLQAKEYDQAQDMFAELGDYSDSAAQVNECSYQIATALMEIDAYELARVVFSELGDYSDSAALAKECSYQNAAALLKAKEYEQARAIFTDLGDYSDAATMVKECYYQEGIALRQDYKYKAARNVFANIPGYKKVDVYLEAMEGWVSYGSDTYYLVINGNNIISNLPGLSKLSSSTIKYYFEGDFYYQEYTYRDTKTVLFHIKKMDSRYIRIYNYTDSKEYTLTVQ